MEAQSIICLISSQVSPDSRRGAPGDIPCSARVWHRMWWGGHRHQWQLTNTTYCGMF